MNRLVLGGGIILGGLAAISAGLLSTPAALSGEGLAILMGFRSDPYFLTAGIWHVAGNACHYSASCIHGFNTGAFALTCMLTAYFASRPAKSNRAVTAAIAGTILAASPLGASILRDPLGTEALVAGSLLIAMAAASAGFWNPTPSLKILLPMLIVLQDPLFLPCALLYAAVSGAGRYRLLQILTIALAFSIRVALGAPKLTALLHPSFDHWAGPPTIVLIGFLVFVAAPFAAWFLSRGPVQASGPARNAVLAAAGLGLLAVSIGMIAPNGDPSPYWLSGEAALILSAVAVMGLKPAHYIRPAIAITAALVLFGQVSYYASASSALPNVAISSESTTLWNALHSSDGPPKFLCVLGEKRAREAVLGDGAFLQAYDSGHHLLRATSHADECFTPAIPNAKIVAVGYPAPDDLMPDFALALAARENKSPGNLPLVTGKVYPDSPAAMPGGHGAFPDSVTTLVGTIPTVTVSAPFSYIFDCTGVPANARLSFAAANPLAALPGASAVRFSIMLGQRTLLTKDLPPAPGATRRAWRFYSVRLQSHSAACKTLIFKVSAPTGIALGTWTTFAGVTVEPE